MKHAKIFVHNYSKNLISAIIHMCLILNWTEFTSFISQYKDKCLAHVFHTTIFILFYVGSSWDIK